MEAKVVTAEPGPGSVNGSTDEQLVAASREGDTRAFRELYDRHVGVVHGVVRWNVDDELESEELTQEVFVRAWT
jgi:DNA-directed RNA polymerase specialized sigma24 family protein